MCCVCVREACRNNEDSQYQRPPPPYTCELAEASASGSEVKAASAGGRAQELGGEREKRLERERVGVESVDVVRVVVVVGV